MTAREIVASFFESNEHGTAKQILKFCDNALKENALNICLGRMTAEGKVLRLCHGRNKAMTYHKAKPEDARPHKAIKEFLLSTPRSTAEQIAEGSGVSLARVRIYLNSRHNAGTIDREMNSEQYWCWSFKKEMPFGCGNEFILALNNALAEARKNRSAS